MQSTLVINKCGKALFLNGTYCGNDMPVEKYNIIIYVRHTRQANILCKRFVNSGYYKNI